VKTRLAGLQSREGCTTIDSGCLGNNVTDSQVATALRSAAKIKRLSRGLKQMHFDQKQTNGVHARFACCNNVLAARNC